MEVLQVSIVGLLTGIVYSIIALAFVVIYRASKIVNLAQGQVVLICAFFVWLFLDRMGFPVWLGMPASFLAAAGLAVIVERVVFRRLIGQPVFSVVMASVGLLILLQGAAQLFFGPQHRAFPSVLPEGTFAFGPISVSKSLVIGAVITVVITELLHRFFAASRIGLRLAAVAEDHMTALSLGISVRQAALIAWILGTLLSLVAGVILLSGGVLALDVSQIGLRALPIALLGGLESVRGALIAGIIVGVGEALTSQYLDKMTVGAASLVFPYLLMILILLLRPEGLFGWKRIERL